MDKKANIYAIPQTFKDRNNLRELIKAFTNNLSLTPPLSISNLHSISDRFIKEYDLDGGLKGWIMVEINNCVWSGIVASIPHEKRMLLLPQCLNNHDNCKAEIDELGLLCHHCMACSIPDLQDKAESLGMMSLVAEGFTAVAGLIESGTVDAIIGVGCLDSLEKSFPLLINNAIPGIAIPLNKSGCRNTDVDYQYVEYRMSDISAKEVSLVNHEQIRTLISEWFLPEGLTEVLGTVTDHTSIIARDWLSGNGKRWRPYLLVSTYLAVSSTKECQTETVDDKLTSGCMSFDGVTNLPDKVRYAAIAVECFHKASLVHDDIQDYEEFRYGEQTVYSKYGTSIAINVGDVLLGEGYKALALCGDIELVKVISSAHISLCRGQGMELQWEQSPEELTMEYVLEIFRNKTAPAFEVALDLGILCFGENKPLREILHNYSQVLGIAYQLQDDLEDFVASNNAAFDTTDELETSTKLIPVAFEPDVTYEREVPALFRPSAVLAALCEQNKKFEYIKKLACESDIISFLNSKEHNPSLQKALDKVIIMVDEYHDKAISSLDTLDNIELKRLLFRVTERILKVNGLRR